MGKPEMVTTPTTEGQIEEVADGKCISIAQLASEIGYSRAWISYLVKHKRISAVKPLGGCWRIPASEVKRIKNIGLSPLPKKIKPETPGEITVNDKHAERVKGKQKPQTDDKKLNMGLYDMFFGGGKD